MDRRRTFAVRAAGVAAMAGAAVVMAAAVASASSPTNIELDNWSPPFVTNDNHPHLTCSFAVEFFGFDNTANANNATVTFTGQSPTGQGVHVPITLGPTGSFSFPNPAAAADAGKVVNGPKGTGWAQHFQLDTSVLGAPQPNQGFHISIDAVANGSVLKQKTVWVQPCAAPPGPDVSLEKSGPADGLPGGQGTYALVAANEGDGAAPASTIVDTLPTGESFVSASGDLTGACTVAGHNVSCPIGAIPAHTSKTVHVTVSYDAGLADKTQLTDCATVTGSLDNPCVTTTMHVPAVHLAKDGPATGIAGGQGTYDITATNSGTADATNQTITDTLPAGETFVSATGASCTATGLVVSCPIGTLAANGGSTTVHVVVAYAANLADNTSLKDCATVTGSADNPCKTTVVRTPKVHLVKNGPATGLAGGQGTYDITATNDGGADATNQTITDTLPAGETFVSATGASCTATGLVVSCPIGTLAANGGFKTVHVVVAYAANLADGTSLTDCATVTGSSDNPCKTTIINTPALHVVKSGPATGLLNGNGTYTIVATNSGTAASVATTFTDTLPAGESFVVAGSSPLCSAVGPAVTCQLGPLAANGGSASFPVVVTYTQTGKLTDCATINGQSVPSCVDTNVGSPNVTVAKSGPAQGLLNDTGVYTLVATNNGNAASTATSFIDTLPTGESFVSAGSSPLCSAAGPVITCQLGALDAKGGGHDSAGFTVVVRYAQTGDLTDCATINGQPVPSCVTTHVVQPNLQVLKTGPATGTLNGNGSYGMVVTNNGSGASLATTFTDTLPAGETFVANGSSSACSAAGQVVTCAVPALVANGGSASYTVVVTYTQHGNLTDCATIAGQPVPSCVTTHIPGSPSISVIKANDADGDGIFHDTELAANPGNAVTFKVVITNTSSDSITIDSVLDAFSATTLAECPTLLGTVLQPGDTVSCTFTVANYAPAAGDSLTNTITVGGHQTLGGTPVTAIDTSTVTTNNPSAPGPDLAIVKDADKNTVKAGNTLTYTLSVQNVGAGPTTGPVTVTDTIPAGLDLVTVSGTDWDCTANGRDITCTYLGGVLNQDDVAPPILVVTTVNDTAVGSVINTGVVDTPGDVNPANNRSTVKTPVIKVLGTKVVKTPPPGTPTTLPFTGDHTAAMLPVGLTAILGGLVLMVAGRRRRRTADR